MEITDLNPKLANAAITFGNKASAARRKAADALASMSRELARHVDPPEHVATMIRERFKQEADRANAEAARWEARASTARAGNLLYGKDEYNDPAYVTEFAGLLSECQAQGRTVDK